MMPFLIAVLSTSFAYAQQSPAISGEVAVKEFQKLARQQIYRGYYQYNTVRNAPDGVRVNGAGLVKLFDDLFSSVGRKEWKPRNLTPPESFKRKDLVTFLLKAGLVLTTIEGKELMDKKGVETSTLNLSIVNNLEQNIQPGDIFIAHTIYEYFESHHPGLDLLFAFDTDRGDPSDIRILSLSMISYGEIDQGGPFLGIPNGIFEEGLRSIPLCDFQAEIHGDYTPNDGVEPPLFMIFRPKDKPKPSTSLQKPRKKTNCF